MDALGNGLELMQQGKPLTYYSCDKNNTESETRQPQQCMREKHPSEKRSTQKEETGRKQQVLPNIPPAYRSAMYAEECQSGAK